VTLAEYIAGISHEDRVRALEIADHLVRFETASPGTVRLKTNPNKHSLAVDLLAQAGFEKPFLAPKGQFIIDCFVGHVVACNLLLLNCLLIGPEDSQELRHMWNGRGHYKGSLHDLPRTFSERVPFFCVVSIAPVLQLPVNHNKVFNDLLDPIAAT
jgi:hypothetical protein